MKKLGVVLEEWIHRGSNPRGHSAQNPRRRISWTKSSGTSYVLRVQPGRDALMPCESSISMRFEAKPTPSAVSTSWVITRQLGAPSGQNQMKGTREVPVASIKRRKKCSWSVSTGKTPLAIWERAFHATLSGKISGSGVLLAKAGNCDNHNRPFGSTRCPPDHVARRPSALR